MEELDEEVLYQVIKRGFIPSFLSKREFYEGLIHLLVEHQGDKTRNWPSIDVVAQQLKNAGYEAEAQELVSKHGGSGLLGVGQGIKSALNLNNLNIGGIGSWTSKWGKGSE